MIKISTSTILGIDLLRGLFSFLVLIAHAWGLAEEVTAEGAKSTLHPYIRQGGFWVIGFFVLSGFCIALSVVRSIERDAFHPMKYLWARFTRIYPLFLVGLAFAVTVWFLTQREAPFPTTRFLCNLVNLQYFFSAYFPNYGPSWSISCEAFYYLLFPIVVFAGRKRLDRIVLIGLAVATLLALTAVALWKVGYQGDVSIFPLVGTGLGAIQWYLGVGALYFLGKSPAPSLMKYLFPVSLLILALTYLGLALVDQFSLRQAYLLVLGIPASFGFALLILSLEHFSGRKTGPVLSRILRLAPWVGMLSYPLYLLHKPLHGLIEAYVPSSFSFGTVLALAIILPLTICGTVGVFLERRFLQYRRGWMKSQVTP